MIPHKDINALFYKFLSDQCTPGEIEKIIDYLKRSESDKDMSNMDMSGMDMSGMDMPRMDMPRMDMPGVEEVKARLKSLPRMDGQSADRIFKQILSTDLNSASTTRRNKHGRRRGAWRVAAIFIGFLILAGAVFQLFFHDDTILYVTNFGETRTLHLPDGSKVILNANSGLRVPEDWNQHTNREVWLEGEAFFSVVHTQEDQKFLVHTAQALSVEVLGTKFNVNDRRGKTSVVLSSGKVKVKAQKKESTEELVMQPGDMVEYNEENQQLTQKTVDPELYTAWRKNLLIFHETSLEEVALTIQDSYGYHIRFANDSLSQLRFTGSNPADNLDLLLKTLAKSFDLNIMKVGKQIVVKKTKK